MVAMPSIHGLREPLSRRFREQRMRVLAERFTFTPEVTVLDVGGAPAMWLLLPVRPRVTLLNIWPSSPWQLPDGMRYLHGDARALEFEDRSFDLTFSNSVIEHVGEWQDQQRFAREVCRVGKRYYIQTPNRRFPVEPHYAAPFVHWLPRGVQRRALRYASPWGWLQRPTQADVDRVVAEIRLLTAAEMRELFPDAEIVAERLGPLVKSWIAMG